MDSIRQYKIVYEIARQQSISRAANALGISQPTLSKYLSKLEQEQGLALFDRSKQPLELTQAGIEYLNFGKKILDAESQLNKRLEELREKYDAVTSIGLSPSRAPYILPKLISIYRQCDPEGKIVIREKSTARLNESLARGDLDMIISLQNDGTKEFASVPLISETTLLAVPRPMAEMDAETVLHTQPLISIGSGLKMWKSLRIILESIDRPAPNIECQSIEAAFSLVRKNFGAMLVPSYLMESYQGSDEVSFLGLPDKYHRRFSGELERKVCLFYKKEEHLSNNEVNFIRACQNQFVQTEL